MAYLNRLEITVFGIRSRVALLLIDSPNFYLSALSGKDRSKKILDKILFSTCV